MFKTLGIVSRDFMKKDEKSYIEPNFQDRSKSINNLITAIMKHPIFIERPITVNGEKITLGRPPENILEIL